jgi:hypothetical protein
MLHAQAKLLLCASILLIYACSHPLEIIGEGDIVSTGNGSSCALEDSPCSNKIVSDYNANYTAVPRAGYGFLQWQGCLGPQGDNCSFSLPGSLVRQYWGGVVGPLRAVFTPHVLLGNLSGDFELSDDCEGHVIPPGAENVVQFRTNTAVTGENQKQCIGNSIFSTGSTNYIVWIDLLHIDEQGQPIFDEVNGQSPIREILDTFGEPFIVGKTYTLNGTGTVGTFFIPLSIEITWLDLNASFNASTGCRILEVQSPIGTPTRRKTYCQRPDSTFEIVGNVLVSP